jgi:hypothetical protein
MKFTIEVPVTSKLLLGEIKTLVHEGVSVELIPNEKGVFQTIRFATRLTDEQYTSPQTGFVGGSKVVFDYRNIDPRCREVERFARQVEAVCVFCLSTARFHWEKMRRNWDQESEEELKRIWIKVDSPWEETRHEPAQEYREGMLAELINASVRSDSMRHFFLFWREGLNAYIRKEYVFAFYNFYFVVEGLYLTDGNSRQGKAVAKFLESQELCGALAAGFAAREEKDWQQDLEGLERALKAMQCDSTTKGLCRFIYRSRGNLHHVSGKQQRPPTLHQEDYRAEATFLYIVTSRVLRKKLAGLRTPRG